MKIYYGTVFENNNQRQIFATVTGQMSDGTLVYTEIKQTPEKSIATENGEPILILDNQYTRHLYKGTQTFTRL